MFLLPDTPRWYYARGRHEEGDDILSRLHDCPLSDPAVQQMRQEILDSIKLEEEQSNQFRVWDLFWDRSDLKAGRRIRIAFMILALQQMMGMYIGPASTATLEPPLFVFSCVLGYRDQHFCVLRNHHHQPSWRLTVPCPTLGCGNDHSLCSRRNPSSFYD